MQRHDRLIAMRRITAITTHPGQSISVQVTVDLSAVSRRFTLNIYMNDDGGKESKNIRP